MCGKAGPAFQNLYDAMQTAGNNSPISGVRANAENANSQHAAQAIGNPQR